MYNIILGIATYLLPVIIIFLLVLSVTKKRSLKNNLTVLKSAILFSFLFYFTSLFVLISFVVLFNVWGGPLAIFGSLLPLAILTFIFSLFVALMVPQWKKNSNSEDIVTKA